MNRIVPIILLVAAVFLHFSYCEWDFSEHKPIESPDRANRMLFCGSDESLEVCVLARSADEYDEAQFWGLLVPAVFFGGACLVAELEGGKLSK